MHARTRHPVYARRAFTLVELMFVVVLMGILAASVIPAMGNVIQMRSGAARDEVSRMFQFARSQAMSVGSPVGVRIDSEQSTLELVGIDGAGDVAVLEDPLTTRPRRISIRDSYPGASITDVTGIAAGNTAVWFDYDGTPHARSNDGSFIGFNEEPVEVRINSELLVVVHAYSGTVQSP